MARPVVNPRGPTGNDPDRNRYQDTAQFAGTGRYAAAGQYADPEYYPDTGEYAEEYYPEDGVDAEDYTDAGEYVDEGYAGAMDYADQSYRETRRTPAKTRPRNPGVSPDHPKLQARRTRVDTWMEVDFKFAGSFIKRRTVACVLIGIFALTPLFLISRPVIQLNTGILNGVEPDIGGTGAFLNLMAALSITPLVTLTRCHWFVPLRRWFGVVMAATAFEDALTQGLVGSFAGGFIGNLTGHTFLLVGLCMVIIASCLAITSNNKMQRALGRYWKPIQRLTYVIWGLLGVHLALLEGLGFQHGTNGPSTFVDGTPIFHQRFYQWTAISIPLFLLRLPSVRRWVVRKQEEGESWKVWAAFVVPCVLFVIAYGYVINELMFKGITAFREMPAPGDDG